MTETWEDRYREKLRDLLQRLGQFVELEGTWDRVPADDNLNVSPYGWVDYAAMEHLSDKGCSIVIPPGAAVRERTYSMFDGTFSDDRREVGLNVFPAGCSCGVLHDRYVRWAGSLGEAVRELSPDELDGPAIRL